MLVPGVYKQDRKGENVEMGFQNPGLEVNYGLLKCSYLRAEMQRSQGEFSWEWIRYL